MAELSKGRMRCFVIERAVQRLSERLEGPLGRAFPHPAVLGGIAVVVLVDSGVPTTLKFCFVTK